MTEQLLSPEEVNRLGESEPTYIEIGRTATELPSGYHHLMRSVSIGAGADRFARAVDDLFRWRMHGRAGIKVLPSNDRASVGSVAILTVGISKIAVLAPVRVVYVVEEPARCGFAYGTLPGHPECGEEAFVVELGSDDVVTFTVKAFSKPDSRLAKLAGPFGALAQHIMTNRYLRAMR